MKAPNSGPVVTPSHSMWQVTNGSTLPVSRSGDEVSTQDTPDTTPQDVSMMFEHWVGGGDE